MRTPRLGTALLTRKILVTCGSGGVGKTTTAAALGLRAAQAGRRVLVCTIDPSRRLATSLGLDRLSPTPKEMDLGTLRPRPEGALWAMTLDTKTTFDALITRHAPSEAARRRILENRFYEQISSALAGSHEYMAMEKLLELSADRRFDLVVLDTPPTRHALDFLDAPDRMLGFLDTSILRYVLRPYFIAGRLTLKVATRTGAMALRVADRALGLQFLQDLSEFFLAFEDLYDGFKERSGRVRALLRNADSGFVLVASPARLAMDEALYFYQRLREKQMPFVTFVVNRVHTDPATAPAGRPAARMPDPDLSARLQSVFRDQQAIARSEQKTIARLEVDTGEQPICVPELDADVHDLRGLQQVGAMILPQPAAKSGRRA